MSELDLDYDWSWWQPPERDTRLIEAVAELRLEVSRIGARLDEDRKRREDIPLPVDRPLAANNLYPSAGFLELDLGTPDMGTVWILKRLGIGGATPITAALGRADVFVMGSDPLLASGAFRPGILLYWVDTAQTLPLPGRYEREVIVRGGEHLWVVVSGGTAGQTYAAEGMVQEYTEAAHDQIIAL